MKLNLKMIAVAAAMVAASSAHASMSLTDATAGNSSFALLAFNTVTNSYFAQDLGYTLNSFLPSSVTTASGDGAVTGNKTPEAGAHITWAADSTFTSWITGMTLTDVKWTVAAGDSQTIAGSTNLSRALVAMSTAPATAITNSTVRTAVNSSNGVSGLAGQNNLAGTNTANTGATVLGGFMSNNGFAATTLTTLGNAASLYYYVTSTGFGSSTTAANFTKFGNSANVATLTLDTTGALTYDLQAAVAPSAVPVPAAAWLMGSGLMGLVGAARRRKAAQA